MRLLYVGWECMCAYVCVALFETPSWSQTCSANLVISWPIRSRRQLARYRFHNWARRKETAALLTLSKSNTAKKCKLFPNISHSINSANLMRIFSGGGNTADRSHLLRVKAHLADAIGSPPASLDAAHWIRLILTSGHVLITGKAWIINLVNVKNNY